MADDEGKEMADVFSKDNTYAIGPKITVTMIILQYQDVATRRLLYWLDQHESSSGKESGERRLKSILMVLYKKLYARWSTKGKDFTEGEIEGLIEKEPQKAFDKINAYLELDLKITKIDTKNVFDQKNFFEANKIKGMRNIPGVK